MANEITTDNINDKFPIAASIDDGDFVYVQILKSGSRELARISKELLFAGISSGGSGSGTGDYDGRDQIGQITFNPATRVLSIKQNGRENPVTVTLPIATASACGLMSTTQVTKLSNAVISDDIVDNLTSGGTNKVLSAEQGKNLQETKQAKLTNKTKLASVKSGNTTQNVNYTDELALKTVGGQSILGTGNIPAGGDGTTDLSNYYTKIEVQDLIDSAEGLTVENAVNENSSNAVSGGAVFTALGNKQDKLVSGTNIVTINGRTILTAKNLNLLSENDAKQINYSSLPSVVIQSIDDQSIVFNLNDSNWLTSNIGKSFALNGYVYTIYNKGTNANPVGDYVSQSVSKNVIYYDIGTSTFYRWDGTQFDAISSEGDGGSGTPIDVLDDNDTVPETGLYFFSDSPLQVVGNLNSLLQDEIAGEHYSQNVLYDVVNRKMDYNLADGVRINAKNNQVYCNGVVTPMLKYGEVVLSNTIKMADTADTAYISFMVSRPFYATTRVTISYSNNVIVSRAVLSNGNITWTNVSGQMTFYQDDEASAIILAVKRIDTDYSTSLVEDIEISNGYETKIVKVIFNPTMLFFREGVSYNGFNTLVQPAADSTFSSLSTTYEYVSGNNYITAKCAGNKKYYCPLVMDVDVDESKFNVLYAVILDRSSTWTFMATYNDNWGGKANSDPNYRFYNSSNYSGESVIRHNTFDVEVNQKKGCYVLNCFIHNKRVGDVTSLNLYFVAQNKDVRIKEFGLITYDESVL